MSAVQPFNFQDVLLGRTADGSRVFVSAAYEPCGRPQQSVTHETVPEPWRLSLSGEVYAKYLHEPESAGQIVDDLRAVVSPVKGVTLADVQALADVWDHWHLNDVHALCAHQTPRRTSDPYPRLDLDAINAAGECPEGYRAGSAWLYESVPESALALVARVLRSVS